MQQENRRRTTGYRGINWPTVVTIVALIAGILTIYHLITYHIDSRIKGIVESKEYIREVARAVRPYLIFDQNESILADMGAMEYIGKIKVETNGASYPQRIVVTPKKHLPYEPLLSCLDPIQFTIEVERGHGFDWVYNLAFGASFGPTTIKNVRFRLEIIY